MKDEEKVKCPIFKINGIQQNKIGKNLQYTEV